MTDTLTRRCPRCGRTDTTPHHHEVAVPIPGLRPRDADEAVRALVALARHGIPTSTTSHCRRCCDRTCREGR